MTLKTCSDCGHKISTQAAWCVRCGAPASFTMPFAAARIEKAINHGVIVILLAPVIWGIILAVLFS